MQVFAQRQKLDGHAQYVPQDGDDIQIIFSPDQGRPNPLYGIAIPVSEATRTMMIEVADLGDPRKDTAFSFSEVEVTTGETVKLIITNVGTVSHGLEIAGADGDFEARDDNFTSFPTTIPAGQQGDVIVRFDDPGTYAFRDTTFVEAGGIIIVTD